MFGWQLRLRGEAAMEEGNVELVLLFVSREAIHFLCCAGPRDVFKPRDCNGQWK